MAAITDLNISPKSISPDLIKINYMFCTVNDPLANYLALDPIATFREVADSLASRITDNFQILKPASSS
jgi:hypothetical protein